ncbi:GntR family transcriptional regulator [Nonomuraea sp. SMC257]|uniref:GntR family transcriptional regulator n=1 Tax=Nonomuraea montanisoli TaxID=2741721 RepID=A0A7Y6I3A8_9ACTN|nr:GntR family transcriptional regulator [Nonomuraea montanisoli]NUW30746.1 GntR family transcriptional regulator [Nonomuraea montanisoli]
MTDQLGAKAPKYQRIADELRRDIRDGVYRPGDRLPGETSLLERFRSQLPSLSLPTLRQAVALLRAEGLIESRQGVGTFVKENRRLQRRSRSRYGRARDDKQLLTSHLQHEITFAGVAQIPPHIAEAAGLAEGTEMVIRRRTLRDRETGKPEELGASYLPMDYASGSFLEEPKVVPKALFLCMEDLSGKQYAHARDQWLVRIPTATESDLLDLATGTQVIHVIHVARADDGSLLEVSESVWPADRIVVIDEYPITQQAEQPDVPSDI